MATVPETIDVREGAVSATRSTPYTGRRPGCSSISARTACGRALRARPRARRLQLQRRLCAGAGAACDRGDGGRHLRRRRGPDCGERGAQRPRQRRGARDERLRRAARARAPRRAVRHHRARPAGVREEQGRRCQGAVGLQGNQPARAEAARAGRLPDHVQLFLQRQRGRCSPTRWRVRPSTPTPT